MQPRPHRTTLLLLALGCGNPASPGRAPSLGTDAAFQTDAAAYRLESTAIGYSAGIGFVFTNAEPTPVYFVNCRGSTALVLEKYQDSAWIAAWGPDIPACLSPPIVVAPGERYRDTVALVDCSFRENCAPRFLIEEIPGDYRIVWHDVLGSYDPYAPGLGDTLPRERRMSNTFRLTN